MTPGMRNLITKLLVGAALLSGGVASADTFDHRGGDGVDRPYPVDSTPSFRDHRDGNDGNDGDAQPASRFERHRERRGFVWIEGHFERRGRHRRIWIPGHYERIRRDAGRY
jgi:WXXGXW repeat (2 copies)